MNLNMTRVCNLFQVMGLLRNAFMPEYVVAMQRGTDITLLKAVDITGPITVCFGQPLTQEEKRALQDQIDTLDDDELGKVTVKDNIRVHILTNMQ